MQYGNPFSMFALKAIFSFQKWFINAVEFKFEPNMTVLIRNLAQKVDFWANCSSNQDCHSICTSTVIGTEI